MGWVDWGNVPEWIGAIGTVGALLVVASALRHEMQARREDAIDRETTQARLISVRSTGGGTDEDGYEYRAEVNNWSDQPIYDVELWMTHFDAPKTRRLVEPGKTAEFTFRAIRNTPGHPLDDAEPSVTFTDAAGRRWQRSEGVNLERIT